MAVVGILVGGYAAESIWGTPLPTDHKAASVLIGLLLAAAMVFGLHMALERNASGRTYIDKATGQEVEVKPKHDLFFIPVKFWPYLLAAIGLFAFFKQ
ncbi:hypothetical protein [Pseudoduganella flava]|nr:hypothetical protein [Pseudoduganella flava]QGZ42586.1 hypothetical protein GO485_28495 [Pseudoduganella flava]